MCLLHCIQITFNSSLLISDDFEQEFSEPQFVNAFFVKSSERDFNSAVDEVELRIDELFIHLY